MENTPVGFVVGTGRGKGGTRRRDGAVGTGGFRFSGDVPKHIRDSGFKRVGCNVGFATWEPEPRNPSELRKMEGVLTVVNFT